MILLVELNNLVFISLYIYKNWGKIKFKECFNYIII